MKQPLTSLFPENMQRVEAELTIESIASKLLFFELQIHMIHWQTLGFAEHQAMNLYDTIHAFIDDFMEKLMGYSGRKIRELKIAPIAFNTEASKVVRELVIYADELSRFAKSNNYPDLDNMAQDLSGNAAKTLFLLTLS